MTATLSMAQEGDVHANGRLPAAHQLIASPGDPSFLAMEATFGVLVSHDSGASWSWICEHAVGYGGEAGVPNEDPAIAMTQGALLAATAEGLARSTTQGCSFDFALAEPTVDVAVRRDDPRSAVALTRRFRAVGDAGENTYVTQVLSSSDDGAHWTAQGEPLDPEIQAETIEVAPSDPGRIYVSGVRRQGAGDAGGDAGSAPVGVVLVSRDMGVTYRETVLPLDPQREAGGAPYVAGVDPTNADRVYVRVTGVASGRLLASDDGGATFRTVYQGKNALLGFALSADGEKIYVGGPADGVLVAPRASLLFAQRSTAQVECLSVVGGTLFACMSDPNAYFVQLLGASTDDGATFASKFYFACLRGPLACPTCAVAAQCNSELAALQSNLGDTCDGGTIPAGPTTCADAAGAVCAGAGFVAGVAARRRRKQRRGRVSSGNGSG
jgi:hypothetical protein